MNSDRGEQTISIAWSIADQLKSMNIPYKGEMTYLVFNGKYFKFWEWVSIGGST